MKRFMIFITAFFCFYSTIAFPAPCDTGISNAPCQPANVRTVVVDRSGGGNYTTIKAAALASKPGDTIQIKNGTYVENVDALTSGTATQPITYMAYPGHRPVFNGIFNVQASWILIDGLDMSIGTETALKLYYFGGNQPELKPHGHVTIRNNYIHDDGLMGIFLQGLSDVLIEKNRLVRNGIGQIHCTGGDWGFDPAHCHGIYISKPGGSAATDTAEDRADCLRPMSRLTIRSNIFDHNSGTGFQIIANRCNVNLTNNLIENNIFIDNSSGTYFYNQTGSIFRNNTIYQRDFDRAYANKHAVMTSVDLNISNKNIIANNAVYTSLRTGIDAAVYPIRSLERSGENTLSSNIFFTRSDYIPLWIWNNILYGNFPMTYGQKSGDAKGKTFPIVDDSGTVAGFANAKAGDFRLTANSPLRNAGDQTQCPSVDFDGNLRNDGNCDVGAFEFPTVVNNPNAPLNPSFSTLIQQ